MESYWTKRTLSRRAALRAAGIGGAGVAALSLIGCGGGDDDAGPGSGGPTTGDAKTGGAAPDISKAKPGGTFKFTSLDPGSVTVYDRSNNYHFAGFAFDGLTSFKWGVRGSAYDDYALEPNLATALPEQSPDLLSMTFKIKPNVKFHNGDTLTSEDIKYTFDTYATATTSFARSAYQVWYDRTETPDPLTAVIKLKTVYPDAIEHTTASNNGYVMNRNHQESPAANTTMVGTGPFKLENYVAGNGAFFVKNPQYHMAPYPFFDRVEAYIGTDLVKRVTDFVTRQVDQPYLVYALDRNKIRQERPDAQLCAVNPYSAPSLFMRNDMAPYSDVRVRQALSMSINREKIAQAVNDGEGENDQYFSLQLQRLNGTSSVKDLGDSAKYWDYNPTEAKRLLSAAGVTAPIETQISSWDGSVLGQFFPDISTLISAEWQQLGVANAKPNPMLLATYNSTVSRGMYEGMGMSVGAGLSSGQGRGLSLRDVLYWGPNGEHSPLNIGYINNPQLSALAEKQLGQQNVQDRQSTFREMEKIIAANQYRIVLRNLSQNWFFDPKVANAWMPQDQGGRNYYKKWWFA